MAKGPLLDRLAPLAKARVPILHVCGSLDPWLKSQTRVAEVRYRELGGEITILVRDGFGRDPLGPKERVAALEFILTRAK
jgi:hypothetical protein